MCALLTAVGGCERHEEDGRHELTPKLKKELSDQEREYTGKRRQIQERLTVSATCIPAFMFLTDFRVNALLDAITKREPELFTVATSLADFAFRRTRASARPYPRHSLRHSLRCCRRNRERELGRVLL